MRVRCHHSGSSTGRVRVDLDVRYADVLRERRHRRHFLNVRGTVRLLRADGSSLAKVASGARLRTGAERRLLAHHHHAYLGRAAGERVLRYIRRGGGCEEELGATRRLSVRTRISERLVRSVGAKASSAAAAAGVLARVSAGEAAQLTVRAADPPLFRARIATPTGADSSFGLAIGRFTNLPIPDVAVPNVDQHNLSVLLGTGTGGFAPADGSPIALGPNPTDPTALVVGDLNGDGKDDIAVSIEVGKLAVLLGTGKGTFRPAPGSPIGILEYPGSLALGDLNADGNLDLAIAHYFPNKLSVLLGDGKGGFSAGPGSPIATGRTPRSVAIGKFTSFPKNDLAVANEESNDVSVLLGTGTGGFGAGPGSPFAAAAGPSGIAVGDLDGDGHDDLAVTNHSSNDVTLLLGDGAGGFTPAPGSPLAVGANPLRIALDDLDRDGDQDLATINDNSANVSVLLNDGSGRFSSAPGAPYASGSDHPTALAIGDLNGDRKPDLAVANYGGTVSVLLNNG